MPIAAFLRPELDLPSRPSQFLAAAGEAAPGRWRVSLRPRLTSRRRPGVESALNKILAQLRVPRWVKGLVPVGALGLARSWQPVHRLWRPLPSERNTIKRVRAGKAIDSYSWLHPLTTPTGILTLGSLPQLKSPLISPVASSRAAPESSTPFPKVQKKTLRPEELNWLGAA